jgi:hypothetical protein
MPLLMMVDSVIDDAGTHVPGQSTGDRHEFNELKPKLKT